MLRLLSYRLLARPLLAALLLIAPLATVGALPPVTATVRYMALGDSLAAGYKAMPAIKGYAYQLYLNEVFGRLTETVFGNASVPGATSDDLLRFQLPQVPRFQPTVVTISIGGNDLLSLLGSTPPSEQQVGAVLTSFAGNLTQTLIGLCGQLPAGGRIYLHDLYVIPAIPDTALVVPLFNGVLGTVVAQAAAFPGCHDKSLGVAQVFRAFAGQDGLLLVERFEKKGFADTFEVHPTNKGHRVIEDAFRAVIGR